MQIRRLNKARRIHIKLILRSCLNRARTTEAHFPKSEIFTNKFFKVCHSVHFFASLVLMKWSG